MENYIIVLFKNKIRKKIIKKFVTYKRAIAFYNNLINKSNDVIFNKEIENAFESTLEIALIELNSNNFTPMYLTDDIGRYIKVKLEDPNLTITKINSYKTEDKLFDLQKNKKITTQEFIKNYLRGDGLKMVSVLNNKIIVQNDELLNMFSLKSESESSRFIDCISGYFFKIKRGDCLFVKDSSLPQRKYLYELLSSKGIDKKILYRKFTTHPHSK